MNYFYTLKNIDNYWFVEELEHVGSELTTLPSRAPAPCLPGAAHFSPGGLGRPTPRFLGTLLFCSPKRLREDPDAQKSHINSGSLESPTRTKDRQVFPGTPHRQEEGIPNCQSRIRNKDLVLKSKEAQTPRTCDKILAGDKGKEAQRKVVMHHLCCEGGAAGFCSTPVQGPSPHVCTQPSNCLSKPVQDP